MLFATYDDAIPTRSASRNDPSRLSRRLRALVFDRQRKSLMRINFQFAMRRSVAQIELLHSAAAPKLRATNEPLADGWQAVGIGVTRNTAKSAVSDLFATCESVMMPVLRQVHRQHPQLSRGGALVPDTAMQAGRPIRPRPGLFHQRRAQPNPRVARHLGHVPLCAAP